MNEIFQFDQISQLPTVIITVNSALKFYTLFNKHISFPTLQTVDLFSDKKNSLNKPGIANLKAKAQYGRPPH